MAFARVYFAAHYPQDMLAGLVLGAAVSRAGFALAWRVLALAARTSLRVLFTAGSPVESAAGQRYSR
ncbi:hypothetical protein [Nocardia terpenica]|uniref:hypothetical protein n=1 Tax=Nocardia terpenica TaxID=455432 RepID=UPI00082B2C73|nr:hypothetical protein [Nocardia terpenica]